MESLYATSRNAKHRCSRDRGARAWLLPGVCWFLGIVQLPRSGVKHVLLFVFALVKFSMPVAVVFSVCYAAHHLLLRVGVTPPWPPVLQVANTPSSWTLSLVGT
jgi:hypothetical protein